MTNRQINQNGRYCRQKMHRVNAISFAKVTGKFDGRIDVLRKLITRQILLRMKHKQMAEKKHSAEKLNSRNKYSAKKINSTIQIADYRNGQ